MSSLATYALNAQIPGASSTQQAAQGVSFTNSDGGVAAGDAGKSNVGMQYITPSQTTQGRITPFANSGYALRRKVIFFNLFMTKVTLRDHRQMLRQPC
jgi:hypothetical protein